MHTLRMRTACFLHTFNFLFQHMILIQLLLVNHFLLHEEDRKPAHAFRSHCQTTIVSFLPRSLHLAFVVCNTWKWALLCYKTVTEGWIPPTISPPLPPTLPLKRGLHGTPAVAWEQDWLTWVVAWGLILSSDVPTWVSTNVPIIKNANNQSNIFQTMDTPHY